MPLLHHLPPPRFRRRLLGAWKHTSFPLAWIRALFRGRWINHVGIEPVPASTGILLYSVALVNPRSYDSGIGEETRETSKPRVYISGRHLDTSASSAKRSNSAASFRMSLALTGHTCIQSRSAAIRKTCTEPPPGHGRVSSQARSVADEWSATITPRFLGQRRSRKLPAMA